MATKPKLSLPSVLVLLGVLVVIAFVQGREDNSGAGNFEQGRERVLRDRDREWSNQGYDRHSGENSGAGTGQAGTFDYYALVLSWSPTHCSSPEGQDDELQCARGDGRRYAFVLHGLWPQYRRGYPQDCPVRGRPWVPQEVINGMLDIMPSPGLIKHEFRKHGTCAGLDATTYYKLARDLFQTIKVPSRFTNPFESQFMSPDDVVDELVDANPGLKPDMLAVSCSGPGNRLSDVRVCFTREGTLRACGDNERQAKLCRASRVHIPPVRSSR